MTSESVRIKQSLSVLPCKWLRLTKLPKWLGLSMLIFGREYVAEKGLNAYSMGLYLGRWDAKREGICHSKYRTLSFVSRSVINLRHGIWMVSVGIRGCYAGVGWKRTRIFFMMTEVMKRMVRIVLLRYCYLLEWSCRLKRNLRETVCRQIQINSLLIEVKS